MKTFTATDLGFGFKSPKNTPPSVEVLADDAAYQQAAEQDQFGYRFDDEKVPAVDFNANVVVLLERGDEGGTDIRPVVNSISRDGDVLTFDTAFTVLPDAQGLDVQRRPYLYFVMPKEAVDGDPRLELVVDGNPAPKG